MHCMPWGSSAPFKGCRDLASSPVARHDCAMLNVSNCIPLQRGGSGLRNTPYAERSLPRQERVAAGKEVLSTAFGACCRSCAALRRL